MLEQDARVKIKLSRWQFGGERKLENTLCKFGILLFKFINISDYFCSCLFWGWRENLQKDAGFNLQSSANLPGRCRHLRSRSVQFCKVVRRLVGVQGESSRDICARASLLGAGELSLEPLHHWEATVAYWYKHQRNRLWPLPAPAETEPAQEEGQWHPVQHRPARVFPPRPAPPSECIWWATALQPPIGRGTASLWQWGWDRIWAPCEQEAICCRGTAYPFQRGTIQQH